VALLKSTTVLELVGQRPAMGEKGEVVMVFLSPDRNEKPEDRGDDYFKLYHMPLCQWAHMGEPAEITVTIEPGDKLNG
jgi:hypothetical protein